jgi:hypothetical protein
MPQMVVWPFMGAHHDGGRVFRQDCRIFGVNPRS